MVSKEFGNRLTNARKEKNFTQEELAVRLGVTPQAISKWERGVGCPDLEMLNFICDILDCSADYLLQRGIRNVRLIESDDEQQKKQLLNKLLAEPFLLEIGTGMIDLIAIENSNRFPTIRNLREQLASQSGVLLPVLRIRDNIDIGEYEYRIMAYDEVLFSETVNKDNFSFEELSEHLKTVTIERYDRILNRQMVQTLIDNLSDLYPAAVKGIIPEKVPVSILQRVIAGLVVMKKPIRNLMKIVEVLEEAVEQNIPTKDLIQYVADTVY